MSTVDELSDLRYGNALYIMDDAKTIALTPHTETLVPGGGHRNVSGTPRAPQQFRLVKLPSPVDGKYPVEGGAVRTYGYYLFGYYDCDIAVGDTWADDGTSYRVVSIERKDHETLALVQSYVPEDRTNG